MNNFFNGTLEKIIPQIFPERLLYASSVLCIGRATDEKSRSQSSRSRHREVPAFVEHQQWVLLSVSEHIFLMGRCCTPIKSVIRGPMNHLMEH